ncbi:unnamed protein product [Prorocentrum cordatum]|uniref:Uncharacterized protein n=1 Tax=Prorocentrum cordatum TaxID=2364126 RepID=A0ABN9Q7X2_9DINO|nr:unnamed protein product [Polarella glacialis]
MRREKEKRGRHGGVERRLPRELSAWPLASKVRAREHPHLNILFDCGGQVGDVVLVSVVAGNIVLISSVRLNRDVAPNSVEVDDVVLTYPTVVATVVVTGLLQVILFISVATNGIVVQEAIVVGNVVLLFLSCMSTV